MSDTKLRPEDLTATVREMYPPPPPLAGWLGFYYDSGFYDSEQGKREDAGWYCSGKVHADREEALCELAGFRPFEGSAIVEVNRALFAPAPEKAAKVETMADRIAADLKAGTFRGEQPAPPEPTAHEDAEFLRAGKAAMARIIERDEQPEPAAPEMPEAVKNAIVRMRWIADHNCGPYYQEWGKPVREAAEELESWWRTHAQPVVVGMTEELSMVLLRAEYGATEDERNPNLRDGYVARLKDAIAAVRQQAAQVKP